MNKTQCDSIVGNPNQIIYNGLKDEMRLSPRLNQHASGVVLGVTQIINGLYNPVVVIIQNPALIVTLASF